MFSFKQGSVCVSAIATTITISAVCPSSAQAAVIDSVNANRSPSANSFWGVSEVGWFYTPTFSYTLNGINTKFGSGGFANNRTVTVEIYNGAPSAGTLLRSANFTALINQFSGGTFASLNLTAGQNYFIGFRNVSSLGVNFTNESGATALSSLRYGFANNGSYPDSFNFIPNTQAILQFTQNSTPIPTPALLPGLAGLGIAAWRKRRANQEQEASVAAEV